MKKSWRNTIAPKPSLIRRLETRRVLDAGLAGILLPDTGVEGTEIVADDYSAINPFQVPLTFDWTITRDGMQVGQSSSPTLDFTPTDDGAYNVTLSLTGTSVSITSSTRIEVANAAPTLSNLGITPSFENGTTTLSGEITDPGADDTFTLEVDWGDGTTETFNYAAGTTVFSETHQYLDDDPSATATDFPEVKLTLSDDDGGTAEATLNAIVQNAAPQIDALQVTDANENGTVTLSGNIVDPGTQDTFLLSVDWGDGSFNEYAYGPGTTSFSETHQYLDDNGPAAAQPTITVLLVDDDNGGDLDFISPTISNIAPEILNLAVTDTLENGSVTLFGQIVDPGTQDSFTLTVDWGDGTVDNFNYAAGSTLFSETHQYLDDDPTGTFTDTPTITVTLRDDDLGEDVETIQTRVVNVSPQLESLSVTDANENGTVTLSGNIIDPGTQDTFLLVVDWGDGSFNEYEYAAGTTNFSETHQYLDDNPTGTASDTPTITVLLVDDDNGNDLELISPTISNVAPEIFNLAVTDTFENGSVTLFGRIVDPGTQDTFILTVDWGDGTVENFNYAAGTTLFSETHQYLDDDPTGTPFDTPTITVTLTDDDLGSDIDTISPRVVNVEPEITNLTASDLDENGFTTLSGNIVDPGTQDTFLLTVDWGDGTFDEFMYAAGTTSFSETHQYLDDNPTGTLSDSPTITVLLTDDDNGSDLQRVSPEISNLNPMIGETPDRSVDEGERFELEEGGLLGIGFTDVGTQDTHTATIDWGDGTTVENLTVTFVDGIGRLNGGHTYADNGSYTVTITLNDDDGGADEQSFNVTVSNINPVLTGTDGHIVNEGQAFNLAGLGVGVSDPGFDNPLNTADPANGGETEETFLDGTIDWGDGSAATPVTFNSRLSGSPGTPTVADPDHADHVYADNGVYTVSVTFADDDGESVTRQFEITVNNVAPTLQLNDPMATINEGDTLNLPMLGSFTDPGFDNPLNPSDATTESFSYTIDWGDGTVETGQLPASVVQGSPGLETSGTLAASHLYADNDVDNTYTITVTLTDDDGGVDVQSFDITVLNVAPTLDPIMATDVGGDGMTTLDLTFSDPGADIFEVLVDWGDKLNLAPEDRFVVERLHAGATPQSFTINHQYTGPPDPANPAAVIIITVKIRDDDFASPITLAVGESNLETVAISNSGIEDNKVAIDTTPQAPAIEFPKKPDVATAVERIDSTQENQGFSEVGAAAGDQSIVSDRYLEIRIVTPDGVETERVRLEEKALDDLPGLFKRLPDNHYRIYLIQEETNSERLVIDVVARGGKLVDPSDDSDGGRDRPPTDESTSPNQQPSEMIKADEVDVPVTQTLPERITPTVSNPATIASVAAAALIVGRQKTGKATARDVRRAQIENALANPPYDRLKRLFRRYGSKRR